MEVVVLHVWSSSRLFVQKVDTEKDIVTFTGMPTFAVKQGGLQPYFVATDRKNAAKPFYPYMTYPLPEHFDQGTVTLSLRGPAHLRCFTFFSG